MKDMLLISIIFMMTTGKLSAFENRTASIDESFRKASVEEGVPESLLRAICWVESNHLPTAYSHGDGTGTNHSFGICQILHSTARGMGFEDQNCFKDFSNENTSKTYKDCKLFGIQLNIRYAARFLKEKLDQYEGNWTYAVAAYNAGSVRVCETGWATRQKDGSQLWKCEVGGILNQKYIDKVMQALEEKR